jgi:hypothetical protein
MDRRMMNEWLKAQAQKQQLTERSFQQKRLGMAITEQLTPKEEKFAKANRHILSEMVKRYGSDKGTKAFYATVREQVKKLHEQDDKTYPQRFPASGPEAGIYVQTGRKKDSYYKEPYQIDTDQYGNLGGKSPDAYSSTITRPSASDFPISNPRVYSSNKNDPSNSAIDPALIDRYGAAKEKEFNRLRDTFRKGRDRDDANNVSHTQQQQNRNNEYLANKFGTQVANTFSSKGLLNKNPSIQSNPELAGQQSAMRDWEGEMIGRRNSLRVDASRFPR